MTANKSVGYLLAFMAWSALSKPLIGQRPSQPASRQSNPSCYPVEEIANALANYTARHKTSYPESTLITEIRNRTVCSRPTVEELDKIRRAGASAKLLEAIESAAPPTLASATSAPAPPSSAQPCLQPPPSKPGRLTVTCADVDCNVFVNGAPIGTTTNRAISKELPEGQVAISVSANGYEPERSQQIVEVKGVEPKVVKFDLHPSRAALEERGAFLFRQMMGALGGEEGLKAAGSLRGSGTFTLYHEGKPAAWEVTIALKLPDRGRFTVGAFQGDRQRYEILRTPDGMELAKMGKGADLEDLNLALHQLQEYQLSATLQRLKGSGFTMVAIDLKSDGNAGSTFRAEGGSEAYSIRTDADLRPQEITLESGGFDKGIKVLYSDYIQQGSAYFPKRMQVQRPGTASNGIKIEFDRVQVNPADLTDAGFDVAKGKR
jgi:hypothetical protein